MDAAELKRENQRLRKQLREVYARSQKQLEAVRSQKQLEEFQSQSQKQLEKVNAQQAATIEQFVLSIEERDRKMASLEHRIKELLLKIRGSRQERIDPDQLLLFSFEELQELAKELERAAAEVASQDEDSGKPKSRPGGRKKLPKSIYREIVLHELDKEELPCPSCGEDRHEIGVESSEQLEYIPARWKVIQHDRVKYART